ncbi:MAG TPA: hypothetical protein VGN24_00230 [Rhodanobacter sp.]|jgi:hypothetical protein|nr:hypothetical protein [Rhodanobacter sp.]
MPAILLWLGSLIATSIGSWCVSALLSLGIGFAADKAGVAIIDHTAIFSAMQSSAVLWNWVGYLHMDTDITIILSAWAGRTLTDNLKVHLTALPKKGG